MNLNNEINFEKFGIELNTEMHSSSVLFLILLRVIMGGMMLFAGLSKYVGDGFDASGYLMNVDAASPVSGIYAWMASIPVVIDSINIIIPLTQVLIGVALITGAMVRLAAFGGAIQMLMFYLGGWEGEILAMFDYTLIYAILFFAIGSFAAGRVLGIDKKLEQLNLVKKYPKLKYFLG